MIRTICWICIALCLISIPPRLEAQPVPQAAVLLRNYQQLTQPKPDRSRRDDPKYPEEFQSELKTYQTRRAELAKTFVENYPNHPQATTMMKARWENLVQLGDTAAVDRETRNVLTVRRDVPAQTEALYFRGLLEVNRARTVSREALAAIERFINVAPNDIRGAELLYSLGWKEPSKRHEILGHITRLYPNTNYGKLSAGQSRQSQGIGKPFELAFTDAVSNKPVSLQRDLKGKVVVIDFWATWCGPCIAEMPTMKRLYDKYRDKGVEFIGVSLDQPGSGRKALLDYVAQDEIPWPQYYQGNGFDSEFSSGWGVSGIPTVFIVDKEGNLASTDARGDVEGIITRLLAGQKVEPRRRGGSSSGS